MSDFAWKDKVVDMSSREIDIHTANGELEIILDKFDWFYCSVVEGNNICVYVQRMDGGITRLVPDVFYGHQVKVGFASYLTCGEKYGKRRTFSDMLNLLEETD
jgi:hypothetical protein